MNIEFKEAKKCPTCSGIGQVMATSGQWHICSTCKGKAPKVFLSNCCGASGAILDHGICPKCGEHCEREEK